MDRVEQLNQRLYARNVASSKPPMVFSPRPVQTKYVKQPIVDSHAAPTVAIRALGAPVEFLPGDGAPFNGFSVDVESSLKNIEFALQKHPLAVYVPESTSTLYAIEPPRPQPLKQPHPLLFAHVVTNHAGPAVPPARQVFNNARMRAPM